MSIIQIDLPDTVLEQAKQLAARSHVALDQILAEVVRAHFSREEQLAYLRERAERGKQVTSDQFLEILCKAPDVPPQPGDELPWAKDSRP